MKITDQGLAHILSLGLKKETSVQGVYFLYEWKGKKYLAGKKGALLPKEYEGADFINLSDQQLSLLQTETPQPDISFSSPPSTQSNEKCAPLASLFKTVVLFSYSEETNSLETLEVCGENRQLKNFKLDLTSASPFKIIRDTLKPFHGLYSEAEAFSSALKECEQSLEKLWITALPIIKDNKLTGVLAGFSNDKSYDQDVFKNFSDIIDAA